MILDDLKEKYKAIKARADECITALDEPGLLQKKEELDVLQSDPLLYSDTKKAVKINSEAKGVSDKLGTIASLRTRAADIGDLIEFLEEENDEELYGELTEKTASMQKDLEALYLTTLLKGEFDNSNAILTLHAGAGGTEAQDWVEMLYRMYRMYADKNGFSVTELDRLDGDEAGIKSVTFLMEGEYAYGFLKAEMGVHRLVRISPFDSNARRHTSFASLEVAPEADEDTDAIKITPEELSIDTYRSGGAGGQHVNKTDSAVRITHIPTGIIVQCQNQRSQIQNRETAMKMLISKLIEKREREKLDAAQALKGDLKKIEWGSQIRSYVFQPYTMVKDHRTGYEEPDVQFVMNGGIKEFIFEYLRRSA